MVVQTTRLGIKMQSSDLWIYWMDGRAGILFLFS